MLLICTVTRNKRYQGFHGFGSNISSDVMQVEILSNKRGTEELEMVPRFPYKLFLNKYVYTRSYIIWSVLSLF